MSCPPPPPAPTAPRERLFGLDALRGFALLGILVINVRDFEQMKLVAWILAAQLVLSPLWLALFRFGPLEWLWRSLTYQRAQPLGRRLDAPPPAS